MFRVLCESGSPVPGTNKAIHAGSSVELRESSRDESTTTISYPVSEGKGEWQGLNAGVWNCLG